MSASTEHASPDARGGSVPRSGTLAKTSVPRARAKRTRKATAPEIVEVVGSAGAVNVKLVYAAYLVGLAMWPAAAVGFGFAWLGRRGSPPAWLASHYSYLVRTFWIAAGAHVVAFALSFVGAGLLLEPLIAVWVVARAVHGLSRAARSEAIEHPEGFFV